MSIEKKIRDTIIDLRSNSSDKIGILLMLSGGVDSMVLAYNLIRLREEFSFDLGFFHLDHMYRGDESHTDYKFVKEYAFKNGIDCYAYRRNISRIAFQEGLGFETCARDVRRSLAETVLNFKGYDYIATAHHMDDSAESIVLNFIRGSGLNGLIGIQSLSSKYIRPLICVRKSEIIDFASLNSISYRDDYTNFQTDYTRNKLRLDIIPKIEEINPNFAETITKAGQTISEDLMALEGLIDKIFSDIVLRDGNILKVDLGALNGFSLGVKRRVIRKLIFEINGNLKDVYIGAISEILKIIDSGYVGKYVDYRGIRFEVRKDKLIARIIPDEYNEGEARVKFSLGDTYFAGLVFKSYVTSDIRYIEPDTSVFLMPEEYLDKDLVWRYREPKDYIRPDRLKGKKKTIKKLFVDKKLSSIEKKSTPLLCDGSEVLWVFGIEKSLGQKKMLTMNNENKNFIVTRALKL